MSRCFNPLNHDTMSSIKHPSLLRGLPACLPAGWMDGWVMLGDDSLLPGQPPADSAVIMALWCCTPICASSRYTHTHKHTDSHFFHSGSICLSERRRLGADHRAYRPDLPTNDHDDNRRRSSTLFTLILTLLKII